DVPIVPELDLGPMAPPPPQLQPIEGMPVANGLALPWMRWTTINDRSGNFRERFASGAFIETLRNRDNPIVALVNHGNDTAGFKALGKRSAWEGDDGLRFSLAFLKASYARDVAAGARHGLYGASVRFATKAENVNRRPGRSQANPDALEERTITAARLVEISLT